MSYLSDTDLMSLIEGRFTGDWNKPAFAFSELLAFYAAVGEKMQGQQVVGWVCALFIIRDAAQRKATDWSLQFNNFIKVFIYIKERLKTEESVSLFFLIFGQNITT